MTAIFRRELSSYFNGLPGYVFSAFLLLFAGIYTLGICLSSGYANFEYVLGNMSFIFLIIVPILSMRVIAAEKKQKTDMLLYSLPVTMTEVVVGKYLAMLAVLAVPTVIIGIYPLILKSYGAVNLGTCYSTLFGFFLLGAALLSIGLFISSLTESQAVSAGVCFAVMLLNYFVVSLASLLSDTAAASVLALTVCAALLALVFYFLAKNMTVAMGLFCVELAGIMVSYFFFPEAYEGLFPSIIEKLSLFERFESMMNGILDLTSAVYLISVSAVFVCLTVTVMDRRRWSE